MSDQASHERPRRAGPARAAASLLGALTALLLLGTPLPAAEIHSYAIVQDDGSLRVQGKTIRLFGVYMPPTERGCRTDFRPPLCGNRSVRALKLKIRGFVRCDPQTALSDGSLSAVCYVDGHSTTDPQVDLGALGPGVLHGVGQGLAHREVDGALDQRVAADPAQQVAADDGDPDRQTGGPGLDGLHDAAVGEQAEARLQDGGRVVVAGWREGHELHRASIRSVPLNPR